MVIRPEPHILLIKEVGRRCVCNVVVCLHALSANVEQGDLAPPVREAVKDLLPLFLGQYGSRMFVLPIEQHGIQEAQFVVSAGCTEETPKFGTAPRYPLKCPVIQHVQFF
jgi:hypothetical protein